MKFSVFEPIKVETKLCRSSPDPIKPFLPIVQSHQDMPNQLLVVTSLRSTVVVDYLQLPLVEAADLTVSRLLRRDHENCQMRLDHVGSGPKVSHPEPKLEATIVHSHHSVFGEGDGVGPGLKQKKKERCIYCQKQGKKCSFIVLETK